MQPGEVLLCALNVAAMSCHPFDRDTDGINDLCVLLGGGSGSYCEPSSVCCDVMATWIKSRTTAAAAAATGRKSGLFSIFNVPPPPAAAVLWRGFFFSVAMSISSK